MTLPELWERHSLEEESLVRSALAASGWILYGAADALGVAVSTLQRVLARHPRLVAERDRKRPKRKRFGGRPKKDGSNP